MAPPVEQQLPTELTRADFGAQVQLQHPQCR